MVMQRRHLEQTPAGARRALGHLEHAHLQHHRHRFDHKNSAHHQQHEFLFRQHRDRSHRAADGETPYVAHENFRGRRVVPEKAKTRAGHRAAKNRQLRCFRSMRQFQIPAQRASLLR